MGVPGLVSVNLSQIFNLAEESNLEVRVHRSNEVLKTFSLVAAFILWYFNSQNYPENWE